jgi:hypothetical protein
LTDVVHLGHDVNNQRRFAPMGWTTSPEQVNNFERNRWTTSPEYALRGHYQYYGCPTNFRSLWEFYRIVQKCWKKGLNRRTRGKTLSWKTTRIFFGSTLCYVRASCTPRFARRVRFDELSAAISLARVCEGEGIACWGFPKRARSWKGWIHDRGIRSDRAHTSPGRSFSPASL